MGSQPSGLPPGFIIRETGQRVTRVEFELLLALDQWRVLERAPERWTVRTSEGETLTLEPAAE